MATAEQFQFKIQRITERLERWADKKPTEKRLAKIERQTQKLVNTQAKLDALAVEQAVIPDSIELPSDSFTFTFTPTDQLVRIDVEAYDSPFDDSFIGGEPLTFRASATGRSTLYGNSSYTSTVELANGTYWDGLNRQTLVTGNSKWNSWIDYKDLTLSVLKGDEVLASESFVTADIFG